MLGKARKNIADKMGGLIRDQYKKIMIQQED